MRGRRAERQEGLVRARRDNVEQHGLGRRVVAGKLTGRGARRAGVGTGLLILTYWARDVASEHGFQVFDVSNPAAPELQVSVVCPGGQGDVSVYGDLLVLSSQETRARLIEALDIMKTKNETLPPKKHGNIPL